VKVAVRTLCEFAAREGDLDFRYTPAPSAEEGMAGHQALQGKRGYGYKSEYSLTGECMGLELYGRADVYNPHSGLLEEIKTHRGDVSRIRPHQRALHRAQLRAYGALLCRQEKRKTLKLALVYFDIGKKRETSVAETARAGELWQEVEALCDRYRLWAEQEAHHREQRDIRLAGLRFPFPQFRPRQRQLAETVYKNTVKGGTLLLEAPTGLGKTLGTLFPALMAMPAAEHDRLYYLTCRNTARQLAVDAVERLRAAQEAPQIWPLRTLELVAKADACEHPDKACHGDSCLLAKGFFDRLPDARAEAAQAGTTLTQEVLAKIAAGHNICPYFLAQEMARWCDLVIGDVNRMFDQSALLHGLTRQNNWKTALLIDEAHNLVDRGRGMYSVQLDQQRLLRIRKTAPKALKPHLDRTARAWQGVIRDHADAGTAPVETIATLIAQQYRERPGHYLAFFSSFKYLNEINAALGSLAPDVPQRSQHPGMSPQQRRNFLAGFREESGSVAFAVLGGVFSEGIDLPGDQLIGAFVATLGLPPFDAWHEILKHRLQQRFGSGYEYTYLIPGLQKVAQAAGRVIRTPEDQGVIWLIDDRFLQPQIRGLLPGWWFETETAE